MRFGGRRVPGYGVIVGWPEDPDILLTGPRGRRLCWELVAELARPAQARIGPAWGQARIDSIGAGPGELASELATAADQRDWPAALAGMGMAAPGAEAARHRELAHAARNARFRAPDPRTRSSIR